MALSEPRSIFGIYSIAPYSRTDRLPYGIMKVLDSSSLSLSGETIDLFGGSNKFPWASEEGQITAEMNIKTGEVPNFAFELFLGKSPTANAAEASGSVSAMVNVKGTSAFSATIGIASIVAIPSTGAADLKFGVYVVKVISATTVKIYLLSDVDASRGADAVYADDNLSVTSSAQTVTSGGNTDITTLGLRLAGGSGTIGMTIGDTAYFTVRPINTKSMDVVVGSSADTRPEFGTIVVAQKRGTGLMFMIDAFRCKANGMPLGMETFAWSKPELTAKLLYDSAQDGVMKIMDVWPVSVN